MMSAPERTLARSGARRSAATRAKGTFLRDLRRNPPLVAWCLFIATLPFYIGRSGLPQPGNALVFVIFPLALAGWDGRLASGVSRTFRALTWFAVWVTIVNAGWVLITGKVDLHYAVVPFYYVFNSVVVFSAFVLARRFGDVFLRATLYAVLLDVAIQIVASFFYRTDLYRGELFFNNPNQLGYWSVLAACLIALTQRRAGLGVFKASVGLTGCAYLAILSGSRAAVGGVAILLIVVLVTSPRVILVSALAALGLVNLGGPLSDAIDASEARARTDRDSETSFAKERGYERIWKYKEYALIGAGEGHNERFAGDAKHATEIHSSFGTVVFSYGIVGTILFVVFLARVLSKAPPRAILTLMPILVFATAHQGLRFTLFWVVLAVFVALKPTRSPAQRAAPSSQYFR